MSDLPPRTEPVPATPFIGRQVTVSLAPPIARYSLRARHAKALETLLGMRVPKRIGTTVGGIACLGPDEWLLRTAPGTPIATAVGLPLAITDISDRSICLTVEGPGAARSIMAGCPLDLGVLAVGRATRTVFETVEIILIRESEDRFQIEVWRSFADWLWTALTTAASD